jgi:endonuclease III
MMDLVIYTTQQFIFDDPFETLASLSLSLAQKKKHINTTLEALVVFTRDGELQQFSVYELANQIRIILGLPKRHHNSLILIFKSVIGAALNYTRHGQVLPTLRELIGTSNPRHGSHFHKFYDDGE